MTNELLDTKEAAKHVRLSSVTLAKLRLTGHGPRYAKLGKVVRYRTCDLDAWVNSRLIRSTSDAAA